MKASAATPLEATVKTILHRAEAQFPVWAQSLTRTSRAKMAVDLMLFDGAQDPAAFLKRAFRTDCVIVVALTLYNKKSFFSQDADFLQTLLKCTHTAKPASEGSVYDALTKLLEMKSFSVPAKTER